MRKILIVDDERGILDTMKSVLEREGFSVDTESDPEKAISYDQEYDIYILDFVMPKIDGLKLAEKIREKNKVAIIILMTAYPSLDSAVKAIKLSIFDYLIKPFTPEYLVSVVKRASEIVELKEENSVLKRQVEKRFEIDEIVFKSKKMEKIIEDAKKVSKIDCDVLITGESGVGKELLAYTIHKWSSRKNNKFVPVNLSAIPTTLIESEIFGYEKGAFTDAKNLKIGIVEYANDGTLFLDEITEVSMEIQVKLLRFIQDRKIRRIGGTREIPINIRIIYASNRDIEEEVEKGRFREDLYWRINVFRIHIPPLRERKEDIEVLSKHFLKKYSQELKKDTNEISDDAMEILIAHSWPGNVRELQNVIKRAIIVCQGNVIKPEDLPEKLLYPSLNQSNGKFFELREKFLEDFERNYIISLYRSTGGNVKKMQEKSGIPRATLYRMIKKYVSKDTEEESDPTIT